MSNINDCLSEILKDESGNTITPECGLEKLLSEMCKTINAIDVLTSEDIDEITSE